jgi:hypothetical protein
MLKDGRGPSETLVTYVTHEHSARRKTKTFGWRWHRRQPAAPRNFRISGYPPTNPSGHMREWEGRRGANMKGTD